MLTFIEILLEIIVSVITVVLKLKMHECPQHYEERIALFNSISNMGKQKPVSLDLILHGDSYICYFENITQLNIVHEYIVKTNRFKNN